MKRQFRDWDKLYAQYKQTNLSVAAFAEKRKIPLSVAYKQFHKRSIKEDKKTDVGRDFSLKWNICKNYCYPKI